MTNHQHKKNKVRGPASSPGEKPKAFSGCCQAKGKRV